jgi:hypothetical protein
MNTSAAAPAQLAWGARVSPAFRNRVRIICAELGINPDWLMACMAFESGESFSPSVRNGAGSGAVGLIQFMPSTAKSLGTTTDTLAAMSAEQQLEYVRDYFKPHARKLRSLSDVYMAILWPAAVGKPEEHVLWTAATRPTTYRQNAGLDGNADGSITKAEAAQKVMRKLIKGATYAR